MRSIQPLADRFIDKVSPEPNTGCWLWTASTRNGYGQINDGNGSMVYAHRLSFEMENGPIPSGLHLDHICRVPSCVNPRHLRVVTIQQNLMAPGSLSSAKLNKEKTHCKRGHELTADNTYVDRARPDKPNGSRQCRQCHADNERRYRAERRA